MLDASAFVRTLNGKPVAVFGLGKSNLAVIRALIAAGASVAAWDDNATSIAEAQKIGARAVNLATADMEQFACLILAPGVPFSFPAPHPVVANAQRAGLEIICDVEMFHRCRLGRKIIATTGTNGKSTTTALLGHILNASGIPAQVGGNIGRAVFDMDLPSSKPSPQRGEGWMVRQLSQDTTLPDAAPPPHPTLPPLGGGLEEDGVFVLELSSFQLDLCPTFAPDIAVLLNITPDHLDRHGGMEGYIRAKARLLRGHGSGVVCVDNAETRAIYDDIRAAGYRKMTPVSVTSELAAGVFVRDGRLTDARDGFTADLSGLPTLRGVHNHQNAAAAFAVGRLLALDAAKIVEAMATYPGLPHRQFLEATIGDVRWINDSMATSAAATARALACFDEIYWIAGGRPKAGGLNGLEPFMPRIRHAFLIGEAQGEFAAWLRANAVAHTLSGTLAQAVQDADAMTRGKSGTVLLSTAAASLDQFENFVRRGEIFAALVHALKAPP